VTLRLFGVAHFVHLATALSAVVAVLPLLPVAAIAAPAVAELFLLRGRPLQALALAALHVGAYSVGAPGMAGGRGALGGLLSVGPRGWLRGGAGGGLFHSNARPRTGSSRARTKQAGRRGLGPLRPRRPPNPPLTPIVNPNALKPDASRLAMTSSIGRLSQPCLTS
jgi:hypothetical protein